MRIDPFPMNGAQFFRQHSRVARERHKTGITIAIQLRSTQPQINIVHRFDASAILKLRITLYASKEMEPASFTRLPITATRAAIKETKRRSCRQLD
jgi:hypothetical protein